MSEATGMDGLRKKLGIIVGPDKAEYDRYDDPSAVSQELVDSVFRAIADAGFVLINMRDADLSQDMEPDLMSQDLMSEKELAERTKAIEMPEGTGWFGTPILSSMDGAGDLEWRLTQEVR